MVQLILPVLHLSVPQLLGTAVFTWILQLFMRKWIVAKRVAYSLPYVLSLVQRFHKDILVGRSHPPGRALTLFHPFRSFSFVLGPFYPWKGQFAWMYARFSCIAISYGLST